MLCAALALGACAADPVVPDVLIDPLPPVVLQPATRKLPLLSITTSTGTDIVSKTTYVTGTITLADSTGTAVTQGAMEIRGRGNTTWEMPKKPYRLKLATSTSLLGMPANRHWVLLANFSDKTLLRNDLTFELGRMMGMAWTPRSRFVDVQVNGRYDGVYQLVYSRASYLSVVQVRNFERWPILGTYVWPNRVVTGSYDGETIALNVWLMGRLQWVDRELSR